MLLAEHNIGYAITIHDIAISTHMLLAEHNAALAAEANGNINFYSYAPRGA